ncbi:MAG: hypothetical protein R2713_03290 [Ilumatobacteraceae bacterium]
MSQFPRGKAAIHQNHGLFTVGSSVDEAAFWFLSMGPQLPGAAARHGRRHAQLIPHDDGVHPASRPLIRLPGG